MTLTQRNLVATLFSQALTLVLGLICLPQVMRLTGVEAYGLVGLMWALQGVAVLMDFGWGVAANRELARLSAFPAEAARMRAIVTKLGCWYLIAALAVAIVAFLWGPRFGNAWLNPRDLSQSQVGNAMRCIGLIIALHIPIAFFASCAMGLQRIVPLSVIRALAVTASYPGAVALLASWSPTISCFLGVQAVVAVVQLFAVGLLLHFALPRPLSTVQRAKIDWAELRRFSTGIFGISIAGLLLSQCDKLLLSKLLTLEQFGYYSLATTISAGLLSIGQPVFSVVFSRLSQLHGSGDERDVERLYHQGQQFLSVLLIPLGVVLAVFSDHALLAWTGRPDVVVEASSVLCWLSVGSTLVGLTSIPYALQLAYGWTRLPLVTNSLGVVIVLPLMAVLAIRYGGTGAAMAWTALGAAYVGISVPIMHRRLLRGAWRQWMLQDVLAALLPALLSTLITRFCLPASTRYQACVALFVALAASYVAAFVCTQTTRQWAIEMVTRRLHASHLKA